MSINSCSLDNLLSFYLLLPCFALCVEIFVDIHFFPNFVMKTLQGRTTLRNQDKNTILHIHKQTVSVFDIQFLTYVFWKRNLIFSVDLGWLGVSFLAKILAYLPSLRDKSPTQRTRALPHPALSHLGEGETVPTQKLSVNLTATGFGYL